MAEAHPVGFQWVMEAKARGAKVIHVDPRFTRTSAHADKFVPIRVGTDIAFLGGIINYVLQNELDFREYVVAYTNAPTVVSEEFRDTGLSGSPSIWMTFSSFTKTFCPQPTAQYGQTLRATRSAVTVRAVICSVCAERTAGPRPRGSAPLNCRSTGQSRNDLLIRGLLPLSADLPPVSRGMQPDCNPGHRQPRRRHAYQVGSAHPKERPVTLAGNQLSDDRVTW